ncbi:hypothetical protein NFIA_049990 [Paecilomyces variotii No. 5]|uniref:Aminoglycoside phosphotransferase domain-containing protein n=1 Tax=Byssochlamys spectabilis (strain No. 5 / NBRC 109023) TaxID=1356009 RepID=V5FH70_BYSSN|nr:hypothetical protein NFIA_049990 [Paecilomyces variotii No. 5]
MSGLEIIGIAASIIQIADLGAKLSVKLCEFYRQIKVANQSLQSLSSDVALTCNILRDLGENLKQDEETQLWSSGAFRTAQEVLKECELVFTHIRNTIEAQVQEQDPSRNRFSRAFRKVGIALIERDLDMLKGNLDRLRSTMLLLLNVIMYAGQVRSKVGTAILQQQREMIDTLIEEKRADDEKFNQLQQTVQTAEIGMFVLPNVSMSDETLPQLEQFPPDVRQYYCLAKTMFAHIDSYKTTIGPWQHRRIRDGMARINSEEVSYLASRYGQRVHELFSGQHFQLSNPNTFHDTPPRPKRVRRPRNDSYVAAPEAGEFGFHSSIPVSMPAVSLQVNHAIKFSPPLERDGLMEYSLEGLEAVPDFGRENINEQNPWEVTKHTQESHTARMSDTEQGNVGVTVDSLVLTWTTLDKSDILMALNISGHFEETQISNIYGNTVVPRRYDDGRDWALKNKPKDFLNKSEADMMQYASSMGVKAPQVRGCVDNPHDDDFVPGDTLLDAWPRMDNSQRSSIKAQLKEQLDLMRKCQMSYIGRVEKQAFRNVFDPMRIKGAAERWKWKASLTLCGGGYPKGFVLTHGDLFPQNIIVHNGKLMGIVDWEHSGFFPEYFEYAVAVSQHWYEGEEWWRDVIEEVLPPCSKTRLGFASALRAAGWSV